MRPKTGGLRDPLWYKQAIIYELPVKSFYDANDDGIGDFPGLIQKLDYIESLGVTCLWLLPFFPSPLRDDGYDIADYSQVHPSYGTLDDFQRFLAAAHERRLHVVIEVVLNHTSEQHPWFSVPALRLLARSNATITCEATRTRSTGTHGLSSSTGDAPTGRGNALPMRITGIGSFITSPNLTMTTGLCYRSCLRTSTSGWTWK